MTQLFDPTTEIMENWCVNADSKVSVKAPNLRIWFDKDTGKLKRAEVLEEVPVRVLTIPEVSLELKDGEHYAGIIIGKEGEAAYHLILLPGEAESVNWADAKEWASKVGGALPNRREQALLYANLEGQFKDAWYWSSEQRASDSGFAWTQYFDDGHQFYGDVYGKYRARAVRRLEIQ